jgi:hypothetical protein
MTIAADLEKLGLSVREVGPSLEAQLELSSSQLINPLTRSFIQKVSFRVSKDRLIVTAPPELVGINPILIREMSSPVEIESRLVEGLNEHIYHLQRRSSELQTLGLTPHVEPETLQLASEVKAGDYNFVIASDRRGNFRVISARRGDMDLSVASTSTFELSEFPQLSALVAYLSALFGEVQGRGNRPAAPSQPLLRLGDVAKAFGNHAMLPPRTLLEILVEVRVKGSTYRFAAARVHANTFRGLLAGDKGKLWAERFELDTFPGIQILVGKVLSVSPESVEILPQGAR